MFRRADTLAGILALAFHAAVATIIISIPPPKAESSTHVEVDLVTPPPKPIEQVTPPKPEEPPPPPKVIEKIKIAPPPQEIPKGNTEPPKEPPKEAPKPVFGVTMDSTTESDSNVSVPVGNTTMIDPSKSGKSTGPITPLPAARPGVAPTNEYKPVSDLYVKRQPEIDTEACARFVQYPSEAQELGIEGNVELKVSLDETGKVHDISIVHGLGHGLDEAAMRALKYKCHFSPAIGTDGKPVPYVISKYSWVFELPR